MAKEKTLEERMESIDKNVEDINCKLSHFLENYRDDYYKAQEGISYQQSLKEYSQ